MPTDKNHEIHGEMFVRICKMAHQKLLTATETAKTNLIRFVHNIFCVLSNLYESSFEALPE